MRVNILNVCAPSADEQKQIAAALGRIPRRPSFAADFEIARGLSTAPETPPARWVRLRREFGPQSPFTNVQYSVSVDDKASIETLAFHLREPKDVMQISIESHTRGPNAAQALTGNRDAARVRLERFGKSSVALARCPGADQSAYESLFRDASDILHRYRAELDAVPTVLNDLAKVKVPAGRNKQ